MSELHQDQIGAEAQYKVSMSGGNIKIELSYDGKGADGGVFVQLEGAYFLDKLKEAIPGEIDDAVIEIIKAAMKAQG